MIFITQLIFIIEGQEQRFDEFESIAIPLIIKNNGRLLLRLRPTENNFIEIHMNKPYEIHLVEFNRQIDLDNFMQDKERNKFIHLKNQSINTSVLIQGVKL